jgi:hypothetical protein
MMSTPLTDHLAAIHVAVERRFYPRVMPRLQVSVEFGPDNAATLLNVSENGLLVSTLAGLDLNSVFSVTLPLNGIPKPIRVLARTIWTWQSRKLSGIQLLELSESDRQLLRKWASLQTPHKESFEPELQASPETAREPETGAPALLTAGASPVTREPSIVLLRQIPRDENSLADQLGNEDLAASRDFAGSRFNPQSSRPVLLFSSAALATILLAVGWAVANSVWEKTHFAPTQVAKTGMPRARRSSTSATVLPEAPEVRNKTPLPDPRNANTNSVTSVSNNALEVPIGKTHTASRAPKSNVNSSSTRRSPETSIAADSPSATPVPATSATPAESTISRTIAHASSATPDAVAQTFTPRQTQSSNSAAVPSAGSFPRTVSVDPMTRQKLANPPSSNSTRQTGLSANSQPAPQPVFPSASTSDTPYIVGRTTTPPTPATNPSDVHPPTRPRADSQPRTLELTPPGFASFIRLPGEQVVRSPSVTIHIQRSVWVHGDRWFWHRRKKVTLGELSSDAAPQIPNSPSYSGSITVQAAIDEDGRITSLRPLYGSLAFLPSVGRVLRTWRYQPTYVDDKPVETQAKIEIDFHSSSAPSRP